MSLRHCAKSLIKPDGEFFLGERLLEIIPRQTVAFCRLISRKNILSGFYDDL